MLPLLNKKIMQHSIRLSKLIQAYLLRREMKSLGFLPDIFISDNPLDVFMARRVREKVTCAKITDEHSMLPHFKFVREVIERIESQSSGLFDFIFASSRSQFEKRKNLNKNVFFVPNAVDFDLFNQSLSSKLPAHRDLQGIPVPRIGYVGTLCLRLDYDLLKKIGRSHPEWSLVMIGVVDNYVPKDQIEELKGFPNIFILPQKPHEEIPGFLSQFDIGIIPFKVDSITQTMNPLKMYEYMAVGLPIVSTDLPEARPFSEVIRISKTHEEFVNLIENELRTNSQEKIQRRIEIAKENSWEKRADQISQIIAKKSIKKS
jgi:glycosyltransferase involved in cell wall biosynthesis